MLLAIDSSTSLFVGMLVVVEVVNRNVLGLINTFPSASIWKVVSPVLLIAFRFLV